LNPGKKEELSGKEKERGPKKINQGRWSGNRRSRKKGNGQNRKGWSIKITLGPNMQPRVEGDHRGEGGRNLEDGRAT